VTPLVWGLVTGSLLRVAMEALFPSAGPLSGAPVPAMLVTIVVVAVVISPIVEELFFRGLLQRALARWLEPLGAAIAGTAAVVLGATAFVALHSAAWGGVITWQSLISVLLLGLAAGVLALLLRSTPAAITAHAAFNLVGVLFLVA